MFFAFVVVKTPIPIANVSSQFQNILTGRILCDAHQIRHCEKYTPEYKLTRILTSIYNSVFIRENTGQKKPVFWYILCDESGDDRNYYMLKQMFI